MKCVGIHLHQEKNSTKPERRVSLSFEHADLIMEIDKGKLILRKEEKDCILIEIKEAYRKVKYSIQQDLVRRVAAGECLAEEADGLYHQVEVIQWLIQLDEGM